MVDRGRLTHHIVGERALGRGIGSELSELLPHRRLYVAELGLGVLRGGFHRLYHGLPGGTCRAGRARVEPGGQARYGLARCWQRGAKRGRVARLPYLQKNQARSKTVQSPASIASGYLSDSHKCSVLSSISLVVQVQVVSVWVPGGYSVHTCRRSRCVLGEWSAGLRVWRCRLEFGAGLLRGRRC